MTSAHPSHLRPLNQPRPVRVRADAHGAPLAVALPGSNTRSARKVLGVEAIQERWRIDDEWWRRPISRVYYVAMLTNGQRLILYHDLTEKRWYTQG